MGYKEIGYLIIYRVIIGLLTRNYEHPDEYWQGTEIAHRLYYGYGYLTWEWTIQQPIRNPVYPYFLSLSYFIVDLFSLDSIIQYAPRFFVQVPLSVVSDYFLLQILKHIYGQLTISTIVVIFSNWYYASTLIRTYFNSFQTSLTIIAFYYWISNSGFGSNNNKDLISRIFVTISYITRPTSIMLWALVWPYELYEIMKIYGIFTWNSFKYILKNGVNMYFIYIIRILMILGSLLVGSIFNNKIMLTQLNFIKYNFIEKWAQLFGSQHQLFYFGVSLPFMLNFGLVFLGLSLLRLVGDGRKNIDAEKQDKDTYIKVKNIKIIAGISIIYLIISSFSGHKQHRYILPIIPFLLIVSVYIVQLNKICFFGYTISKKIINAILLIMVLLNIFLFVTLSFYGKSSGIEAWRCIDNEIVRRDIKNNETAVIVFGQAHFMPGLSLLHKNITFKIPDSSAPKMAVDFSENKLLISDPRRLFSILTENSTIIPTFVIAQGKYLRYTAEILNREKFKQVKSWRYCTLLQQIFIEYDSIHVYQFSY